MAQVTFSPINAVFQGRVGGWPGFPTFTDPTQIYIASPVTVNWKVGGPLVYTIASSFPIPLQGKQPLTLFVTLSDPTRGGTATINVDTDNNRWSQNQDQFANLGIVQVYAAPTVPPQIGTAVIPWGGILNPGTTTSLSGANKVQVCGFYVPYPASVSSVTVIPNTTDVTHLYDWGIYDSTGKLVTHVGARNFPSGGTPLDVPLSPAVVLAPGKYYFAFTGNAVAASLFSIGGLVTPQEAAAYTFADLNEVAQTSSGGVLPASISPPADAFVVSINVLSFILHS